MTQMNRITWHHTGGGYHPNPIDLRAYHRLVTGDGAVVSGQFEIRANAPGIIRKGHYAAHTARLNTGNIGVSICAMAKGQWASPFAGPAPVKPAQIDAMILETAALCRAWSIEPSRRTTLSHAEVQPTLGVKQASKWDFDYDPRDPFAARDPVAIGDDLRAELALRLRGTVLPPPVTRPILRQGSVGPDVAALQRLLGVTADSMFGPKTAAAVITFQRRNNLLPDGIVGRMTWAALSPET